MVCFVPSWFQRQRVLLECTYHHLCIHSYRPMISFTCTLQPGSSAEAAAVRSAGHAMALISITQQGLEETSILDGWHEAFNWQWDAAMTLLGFIMMHPHTRIDTEVKHAISLSISVLETLAARVPAAAGAVPIVRDLSLQANVITACSLNQSQIEYWTCYGEMLGLSYTGTCSLKASPVAVYPDTACAELGMLEMELDVEPWDEVDMPFGINGAVCGEGLG